jgi:two-component system, OmpR family, response regulator
MTMHVLDEPKPRGSVLVAEGEPLLREAIEISLRHAGLDVTTAGAGDEALQLLKNGRFDLVVDGLSVVRQLRLDGHDVPVIFLIGDRPEGEIEDDMLAGLVLGDDCLTRPFRLEELVARVRAVLLRRIGGRHGKPAPASSGSVLAFADIELDQDTREVRRDAHPIDLTPTEFRLLRYLMLNSQRVVSRAELLERVWQYDFGGAPTVVTTYVAYLRRKLIRYGPDVIYTHRGVGYRLRTPKGQPAEAAR